MPVPLRNTALQKSLRDIITRNGDEVVLAAVEEPGRLHQRRQAGDHDGVWRTPRGADALKRAELSNRVIKQLVLGIPHRTCVEKPRTVVAVGGGVTGDVLL